MGYLLMRWYVWKLSWYLCATFLNWFHFAQCNLRFSSGFSKWLSGTLYHSKYYLYISNFIIASISIKWWKKYALPLTCFDGTSYVGSWKNTANHLPTRLSAWVQRNYWAPHGSGTKIYTWELDEGNSAFLSCFAWCKVFRKSRRKGQSEV